MPSTDRGTTTTTRRDQSPSQASATAGTARSARSAKRRSIAVDCPTPRTRLCVPRTTSTAPWSQGCCPDSLAGRSESTAHVPPVPSRLSRTVRPAVTGPRS